MQLQKVEGNIAGKIENKDRNFSKQSGGLLEGGALGGGKPQRTSALGQARVPHSKVTKPLFSLINKKHKSS